MTDDLIIDILSDPLSPITRKERRNLLVSASVAILVGLTDLYPTKIAALGVSFDTSEQNVIAYSLIALILYFIIAFVFYGWADFLIARKRFDMHFRSVRRIMDDWTQEDQRHEDEIIRARGGKGVNHMSYGGFLNWKLLFEFGFPTTYAIIGIVVVVFSLS